MKKTLLVMLVLGSTVSFTVKAAGTYDKLQALMKPPVAKGQAGGGTVSIDSNGALANGNANPTAGQNNAATSPDETAKKPTLRSEAFRQLVDKNYPLTAEQIQELHKQLDVEQQSIASSPNPPPKPVSSTLTIDLSPGITPPVIRLGAGFVTSVIFVDSTGQPWPVADYSIGNPKTFNIQWDKKTNALFMQSSAPYASGNLAIRLAKLDTPIMLSLVTGQREVDYRVDLQVYGRGPQATPIAGGGPDLPNTASTALLNALDGIAPEGSTELEVTGGPGQAWLIHGKLLFRSKLTVLSPAWSATVSSADGTHVYELAKTPLILASHNGKPINIVLKGL